MEDKDTNLLFLQLVASFQASAMMQLGKMASPMTGELDRDLDQARHTIDMLVMIQEKTKGNLTDTERDLLDKYVFELQMNYMHEMKAENSKITDEPADSSPESSGEEGNEAADTDREGMPDE